MMRQVDGGFPFPLHLSSIQVGDHKVRRTHLFVIHAAGFDEDQSAPPVNAAGVPAVHGDEAGAVNPQISFPNLVSQLVKCGH